MKQQEVLLSENLTELFNGLGEGNKAVWNWISRPQTFSLETGIKKDKQFWEGRFTNTFFGQYMIKTIKVYIFSE